MKIILIQRKQIKKKNNFSYLNDELFFDTYNEIISNSNFSENSQQGLPFHLISFFPRFFSFYPSFSSRFPCP